MTEKTGGEWVVEALRAEGVRHVFGIPGIHNLAIYDALLRQSDITHVLARHEAGAGFMADGYARASGEPGVVLVTTGPGATNALTPLVEAYAGSQPVLLLMSDIPAALIGQGVGALHEVPNQIDCFRPVCRWAETLDAGRDIPGAVQGAFHLFRTGRPGPVALSIPTDLLTARVAARLAPPDTSRRPPCDVGLVAEAAAVLATARRPLLVAGGGVVAAGAGAELQAVAERLGAPVVTSVMGRGAIPETHPHWLAVLPNGGATRPAFEAADVVLAVGLSLRPPLDPRAPPQPRLPARPAAHPPRPRRDRARQALQAHARPRRRRPGRAGRHPRRARAGRAARRVGRGRLAALRAARSPRYTPEIDRVLRILRERLAPDAIVVSDQTGINYWMEWFFPVLAPRTFLYPVGSATLGYAVPAAIGARLARPTRQVVAVVGDGGFLYSVNELATAVKYGLPIVFLVVNDDRYGAIKYLQERMFGRWGETDLANPDFPALARAFGAHGERVAGLDGLGGALEAALARSGPSVLELPLTVDPPWEL